MSTPYQLSLQIQALANQLVSQLAPSAIIVKPGDNLQNVLDNADNSAGPITISVQSGSYGPLILKPKSSNNPIMIAYDQIGNIPNARINPSIAVNFPQLTNITTISQAGNYIISGFTIGPYSGANIVQVGADIAESDVSQLPHDLVFDRCFIKGDPTNGNRRGIAANGINIIVRQCYINNCFSSGVDSQAISAWNTPGPLSVLDCYLEAASETVMIGGEDTSIPSCIPSHITVQNCTLTKNPAWFGAGKNIKNIFELKNARFVLLERCQLSYSWVDGQTGFGLMLTPRNQNGSNPWAVVSDVVIDNNTFDQMSSAISVLGTDDINSSQPLQRVQILNNKFTGIMPFTYNGQGRQIQINNGAIDLEIGSNVFTGEIDSTSVREIDSSFLHIFGNTPTTRLNVHDNEGMEGDYGIWTPEGLGLPFVTKYVPDGTWTNNIIHKGSSGRIINYPPGTILK